MTRLALRLDLRAPDFARVPPEFYRIGLDMAQWADANGFAECMLSEHHGTDDGYLPSPLVYAAAVAARTRNLRIRISALVLPLHDPLRIAEDAAVLDLVSEGRLDLVVVAGFRATEYAMFDRSLAGRGKVLEAGIDVLRKPGVEAVRIPGQIDQDHPDTATVPGSGNIAGAPPLRRPAAPPVLVTVSFPRCRACTTATARSASNWARHQWTSAQSVARPPSSPRTPTRCGKKSRRTHCMRPTNMLAGTPNRLPVVPMSP